MLTIVVVLIVIGSAACMLNEGLYSAAIILICTIFSGIIAFCLFEPVATWLETQIGFVGYGDIIAMLGIFSAVMTGMRVLTESMAPKMVQFPELVHRGGGFLIGAWTGWILSGIILCALQTLPLHQNFMGYDYRDFAKGNAGNPDRYWLAFVNKITRTTLARQPAQPFDSRSEFAIRYHRYRRTADDGNVQQAAVPKTSTRPSGTRQSGRSGGRRRRGT